MGLHFIFLSFVLVPLRLCRALFFVLFVVGQLLFLVHFCALLEHESTLQ
jgi:hypothetical protein